MKTPFPGWQSPYAPVANCPHEQIVDVGEYSQPPLDWSLPMGGWILYRREWACADCGVERDTEGYRITGDCGVLK